MFSHYYLVQRCLAGPPLLWGPRNIFYSGPIPLSAAVFTVETQMLNRWAINRYFTWKAVYKWSKKKEKRSTLLFSDPRFSNELCFRKFPWLPPVLVTATCRRRWLWSFGGTILTGEYRSTWSKKETCPSSTSSITFLKWTDRESKPGLRGKRTAVNHLSHVAASKAQNYKHV